MKFFFINVRNLGNKLRLQCFLVVKGIFLSCCKMHCILVFDHINDIIFYKCDSKFVAHIKSLEKSHGVTSDNEENNMELNINFLIQLFSPLVTSQRIMTSQFGNSYTSVKCDDGTNMVFDEYMGYLFVTLGSEDVRWLKRLLGICISNVQHLCGPYVSLLKLDSSRGELVGRLVERWRQLTSRDQGLLVEAVEQLFLSSQLSQAVIRALSESVARINSLLDHSKAHALIFVENKFLSLYSSMKAKEMTPGDLLFLSLLADCTLAQSAHRLAAEQVLKPEDTVVSEMILLSEANSPAVTPYCVHISTLAPRVSLLLLYQTGWEPLSLPLHDSLSAASLLSCSYTEQELTRRALEGLEGAMKKLLDAIKKIKQSDISPRLDACIKVLHAKWDLLKKSRGEERILSASASSLSACLRDLLQATCLDPGPLIRGHPAAQAIARCVHTALAHFTDFLQVKALAHFTLGSCLKRGSLSITKYLEEFPGLVHFLYIDRTSHRLTAPAISVSPPSDQPSPHCLLDPEKIWSMVELSRLHLEEGHLTIIWRDAAFSYAYFLWFEDLTGSPLKPKVAPSIAVKSLPLPGVFSADFYKLLMEACFPKTPLTKLRCFELYCIHLGLATSACVLEQSRRIAATISEVTGLPTNPLDLL